MVQTRAAKASALSSAQEDLEDFLCRTNDIISFDDLKQLVEERPELISSQFYLENAYFLLGACENKHLTLEVIQYLLKTFPGASSVAMDQTPYGSGECPAHAIHMACMNTSCPDEVLVELINDAPVALTNFAIIDGELSNLGTDYEDGMWQGPDDIPGLPLHYYLARESNIREDMLEKMITAYPESIGASAPAEYDVRFEGITPIHVLLSNPNVCDLMDILQYLIETHPSMFRKTSGKGKTSPLHVAIQNKSINVSIIEMLIDAWPESLLVRCCHCWEGTPTDLPIHTLCSTYNYDDVAMMGKILELLMSEHPASFDILSAVQLLFDAHPEGLFAKSVSVDWGGEVSRHTPLETASRAVPRNENGSAITRFLEDQLDYARMAKDHEEVATPDNKGRLALHKALFDGATHGSIKLLLKGHPSALQVADNSGKLPLHLACEYGSVDTVKLFVDSSSNEVLDIQDGSNNYPLHLACLGSNYEVVQFLLRRGTSAVSQNGDGKQPLHLLCEAETDKEDDVSEEDESVEETDYVATVFMLLKASPEIVSSFSPLIDTVLRSGGVWKRARTS